MKITLSKQKVRRKWRWVVSRRVNGRRKRIHFTSKTAAESEASRLKSEAKDFGDEWSGLTSVERIDLVRLYRECQQRGLKLADLMTAAVQKPKVNSPLVSDVITELLDRKRQSGRAPAYVQSLEIVINQFAAVANMSIAEVTVGNIEAFMASKNLASRATIRSRLSTLFKYAVLRRYISVNPCQQLETITIDRKPPAILTTDQFEHCVQWLCENARYALPWFVLTTCCGLRPHEAQKTRRSDIHFDEGWIKVEAQTSKVRQRRVVYPKPEALALLKRSLRGGKLPLSPQLARRAIAGIRWKNKSGVHFCPGLKQSIGWRVWPHDITRHSAASYWLADCDSTAAVARNLGHSETVLMRHYAALVTREQARQFWLLVRQAIRRPSMEFPYRRRP